MKFGKQFKKQMVPEWTETYMDYNGLKRILREIMQYKQTKQPSTSLKTLQQRLSLHRYFSSPNLHSNDVLTKRDVEDQAIDVKMSPQDGFNRIYKTRFLRQSGEGGGTKESLYFNKLDEELSKVNKFYKDKVDAVMNEATLLNKQLDALVALRIRVENPDLHTTSSEKCSSNDAEREHMKLNPGMEINDQEVDQSTASRGPESASLYINRERMVQLQREDEGFGYNNDPLEILKHVKINNTIETPLSTLKFVLKDTKEDELTFRKDELKEIEERLRHVFIEFYRQLRLLKLYSYMNLAAFSKIMKKYEKVTSRRASMQYMRVVDNSYLGSSDEVSGLLERVEAAFINHFSNTNRREGMKILRPQLRREKHRVTFFSGFFSGFSIALFVAIFLRIEALKALMDKPEGSSYVINILPLYSLFGYIVLHMLMYAANTYFWRRYRINYPFIFGFKEGTELGYREFFLLSAGLAVLVLASFLANLEVDMGSKTQNYKTVTELVPLGLVAVVFVMVFCPFNIIYRSSRFFFIKCLFHCFCAPLYKVTLPDFFLADQLTSQVQAIRCLELYLCYYGLGEYSQRQNKCHSHGAYNAFYFIVAVIPYWLRFLQCLRRLWEDKDPMHGYNGLKYLLTTVAVLMRTAFELNKGMTWMVLAFISSGAATLVNIYWDIVIDWGLLQRQSKNFGLRDKLVISHRSVYFTAVVLNIILRVAWMQLVLEFNWHSLHKMAASIIISCLEIIRRGIWSFFRLENEHLNNVGKFRAFKSVPLPFNYYDEDSDKDG